MAATLDDGLAKRDPVTPPGYEKLHKVLLVFACFLFIYLVVEAIVLIPYIVIQYGWQ